VGVVTSAANWRKSRRCESNQCVEFARIDENRVGLRDSADPLGPALMLSDASWKAFVAGVRAGEFDRS